MGSNSGRRPGFGPMFTERLGSLSIQLFENRVGVRSLTKRILVAVTALLTVGVMPAQAEELKDWQYDEQTRSLTFTLPNSVVPLISVIAPDQLVLELPDTQVGNVMSQSVRDGLVDSIVLEQATPETVWVVMDFAAGTVLATTQDATPIAEAADGSRQWQMRPALVAASRRAAQSVARSVADADVPTDSAASVLRTPAPELAQSPDFSNLPVLEPAMPIDEPVSVPPLNVAPLSSPPVPAGDADTPSVIVPPLEDAESANVPADEEISPVFEVEVIPAEPPVAVEIEPIEPLETVSGSDLGAPTALSTAESQTIPAEPPFLNIEGDAPQSVPVVESFPAEPLLDEPPVAVQSAPNERFASSNDTLETIASEPATSVPTAESFSETADIEPIQPANVSRWPEPIPFGQPLPK